MTARLGAILLALCAAGCAKQDLIDGVMKSAPRPGRGPSTVEGFRVLSGDTHCHVSPPDAPWHVSRDLGAVLGLARDEGLDFVVLTPHVRARFFADPTLREAFRAGHGELQREIGALGASDVLFAPGFEYTDHSYGHVGLAFGDALGVLERRTAGELAARPEVFFEDYRATGGLVTVNHPAVLPIPSPFAETGADLSFRAYHRPTAPYPAEIDWLARNADAIETFNLGITNLRDRLVLGDLEATARASQQILDTRIRRQGRRITAVGGSDSHGMHLRPVTWVLARTKDLPGLREALRCGRTCVRSPEACAVRARALSESRWHVVGGSIADDRAVLDLPDEDAEVFVDGAFVPGTGRVRLIAAPGGRCSTIRVRIGTSSSGTFYLGCGPAFAECD